MAEWSFQKEMKVDHGWLLLKTLQGLPMHLKMQRLDGHPQDSASPNLIFFSLPYFVPALGPLLFMGHLGLACLRVFTSCYSHCLEGNPWTPSMAGPFLSIRPHIKCPLSIGLSTLPMAFLSISTLWLPSGNSWIAKVIPRTWVSLDCPPPPECPLHRVPFWLTVMLIHALELDSWVSIQCWHLLITVRSRESSLNSLYRSFLIYKIA